jgi:hypothetical protein
MLFGFLGLQPTANGLIIDPKLPADWPELTITRIHIHDHVLNIMATHGGGLKISGTGPQADVLTVEAPRNVRLESTNGVKVFLTHRD